MANIYKRSNAKDKSIWLSEEARQKYTELMKKGIRVPLLIEKLIEKLSDKHLK